MSYLKPKTTATKPSSIVFSAEVIHEKKKKQFILHGPTSLAKAWALSTVVSIISLILSKSSKTLSTHLNILLAIIINNNYKS